MPYKKRDTWYVYAFDEKSGKSRPRATTARNEKEAIRFEDDLRKADEKKRATARERTARIADGAPTFADAFDTYKKLTRARSETIFGTVEKHTLPAMGPRLAFEITTDEWSAHFNALVKSGTLAASSANRLRTCIQSIYTTARIKPNPIDDVKPHKIIVQPKAILDADEVPRVFAKIPEKHRAKFAIALHFASRKNAVLGLTRSQVDEKNRTIRLYESKVEKWLTFDIPASLWPFLESAMKAAKGERLFTNEKGKPYATGADTLVEILRAACVAAGVIVGWRHVCRRSGCGYDERADAPTEGTCPKKRADGSACGFRLASYGIPRPVTFRSLRTSVATIARKQGRDLGDVQQLLAHASPTTTARWYVQEDGTAARRVVASLPYDLTAALSATRTLPEASAATDAPKQETPESAVDSGVPSGRPERFRTFDLFRVKGATAGSHPAPPGESASWWRFGQGRAGEQAGEAALFGALDGSNATRNATGPTDDLIAWSMFGPWATYVGAWNEYEPARARAKERR